MVNAVGFMRAQPAPSAPPVNISQIAGTTPVTAGVNGLQAVGGNIAPAAAATSYPVPMGAVDTTGKTRRVLTDPLGRLMTEADLPATFTPQVNPVVGVADLNQTEGQTQGELLSQILTELRLLNLKFHLLPQILNSGNGSNWDEPSALRNDPTALN
jgi:hypothetical protein